MGYSSSILIVEDQTALAEQLAALLKESGYHVIGHAQYAEDAVRIAHETLPDLVLMDISLKGSMNGITAARVIQSRVDVPIVYLTASGERELLARSKPATPRTYVSKPIVPEALLSTVELALYRHQMEKRLRENEECLLLASAVEQADDSIVITDTLGTIVYVNRAFERTTGYNRSEAIGQNSKILKSGHHSEAFYRDFWRTIIREEVWRGHFINRKRDGALYEEEATVCPIKGESGDVVNFVAVKRDVSTEFMRQKQLIQAQRMEAVGNLAGGIAHDFNNLLQVILGFADVLLHDKAIGDRDYEELHTIRKAAKDGSELVKQILTFSRSVETLAGPIDLNTEVIRVKKLLYRTIPKMISIELHLADHLKTTNADPGQIEQVLLNLAVNAKDAMPDGGRLTIETRNVTLDHEYCRSHLDARPGDHVLLMITDTGHGMEAHVAERIFEPFFSTKQPGEGTGLGLAMVFGIVKNHGGHITCHSKPGGGTAFKIYLPAVKTAATQALDAPETSRHGGNETLLVVDDEDLITELAEKTLVRAGYTVLSANSGDEALALYVQRRHEISLVILDLIMPGTGGKGCLERLLEIDPNVRVLISSGYSVDGPTRAMLEARSSDFLGKPYDGEQLLTKVRSVLDRG